GRRNGCCRCLVNQVGCTSTSTSTREGITPGRRRYVPGCVRTRWRGEATPEAKRGRR
ncbi:unnamed protein product, partial [Pylaiella littoralis]